MLSLSRKRRSMAFWAACLLVFLFAVPATWARKRSRAASRSARARASQPASLDQSQVAGDWIQSVTQAPHVWEAWTSPFPCVQTYSRDKPSGLLYVKVPKTGSSTTGGVARRIAARTGKTCKVMAEHNTALRNNYGKRQKGGGSFMFTMLRQPETRALSFVYFFDIKDRGRSDSDASVIKALRQHALGKRYKQLGYIRTDYKDVNVLTAITSTLREYNFIGVTERIDESFVALRLLLGLDAGDVLHLSSKVGGQSCAAMTGQTLQAPKLTPAVSKFFESKWWKDQMSGDTALWLAVNASLDATIAHIGRERFDAALREHRELQAIAERVCTWPCDADTQWFQQQCYWGDNGCGFPCFDELAPKDNLEQATLAQRTAKAEAKAKEAAEGVKQRIAAGTARRGAIPLTAKPARAPPKPARAPPKPARAPPKPARAPRERPPRPMSKVECARTVAALQSKIIGLQAELAALKNATAPS